MSSLALSCQGLHKAYGGVRAVHDVSFHVCSGEVVGLVGPNGAGKSTVVDLISGEQSADTGQVLVADRVLSGPAARRAKRAKLARTFQYPQIAHELTALENVLIGAYATTFTGPLSFAATLIHGLLDPRAERLRRRAEEVAGSLSLRDLDRPASELTLGELRLLEAARALSQDPEVVLLDEPFAGLDADGIQGLSRAIRTMADAGCAVLLVDHNIDIVVSLVNRVVLMAHGEVRFDGDPAECMASAEMKEVYFGDD
ncbi:ATP-binding cassette domain-containing protein [Streptosporangium sp. NBC_01755]|uniref:ABC transporter ATP-binding protein n=1 Tax=unclassified Streptosporangium TaxID=2632669 RepID=UPI002DD9F0A3|nr:MULTISPECIES: ATP-binding cassette domain-containing protein [unclassified Streptosporangium]WSA26763.1 ATP-binding cassette domain-containing protein [Streptosporangium sp. NBC_01810]WSD01812.1 ATP-binding cassette domain-containing protein [Streptosporangium sp. NBC_01755]